MANEVGDLAKMRRDDPYFDVHLRVWQRLRVGRGETPGDWDAFRAHLLEIGAWDPGTFPFPGFGTPEVRDNG